MDVIGVGAQDDLAQAKEFIQTTGVSFTMLWSSKLAAWQHFKNFRNSGIVVLDKTAENIAYGPSSFNSGSIKSALDGLS